MSLVVCIRKKQALARFSIFCRLLLVLLQGDILLLRFSASCLGVLRQRGFKRICASFNPSLININFSRRLQKPASVFYIRRKRNLIRAAMLAAVFLFTLFVLLLYFIFQHRYSSYRFYSFYIYYDDFYFCGPYLLVFACISLPATAIKRFVSFADSDILAFQIFRAVKFRLF